MTALLADVLGWIGGVLLVIAYAMVSQKKIDSQSVKYQMLNIVGGFLLIINTVFYGAFPSAAVNVIWVVVGVYTVMVVMRKRGSG